GEAGGLAFVAYELVEGARPLVAEPGAQGRARFLDLAQQLIEAVAFAHAQGVLHRDLKPENVLVDAEGRVRVTDFGLAWARGTERLTQTQGMLGTPHYMAPEAFQSVTHEATLDVFSLGAILYEGLTGSVPHAGNSLVEVAAAAASGQIKPPRRHDPSITPALESVVLRALSTSPARRYPDAGALGEALEQARHSSRSRSWAPVALGIFALCGVAGLILFGLVRPKSAGNAPTTSAPTPEAQPVAKAPKPLSPNEVRRASAALRELRAPGPKRGRVKSLREWLANTPTHPEAPAARALLGTLELHVPRVEATHPPRNGGDYEVRGDVAWQGASRFLSTSPGPNGLLCAWDAGTGKQLWSTALPHGAAAFSDGGQQLVTLSEEWLEVWTAGETPERLKRIAVELLKAERCTTILVLGSVDRVLLGFRNGWVIDVDVLKESVTRRFKTAARPLHRGSVVSSDGRWLATSSGNVETSLKGEAFDLSHSEVWDLDSGKGVAKTSQFSSANLAFVPGEQTLAVSGRQTIQLLPFGDGSFGPGDYISGEGLGKAETANGMGTFGPPKAHPAAIWHMTIWKGQLISSGGNDDRTDCHARVWDLASRAQLRVLELSARVQSADVSDEGLLLFLLNDTLLLYPLEARD
ncbi:MAG: protein kinase, partial [Gemmatimonadales bacterium]|nr:protein kinase [Gemmatimonadales bacterium]